jgi:molybdopterin synthase catalytic subunit
VLKEHANQSSEFVDVPDSVADVSAVLQQVRNRHPSLTQWLESIAVAVNQEYAAPRTGLKNGDEVALLPPVSGGSPRAKIVREPIDSESVQIALKQPEDGAVVVFEGIVRNNTKGRRTIYLDYEAYEEMALKQLESLTVEAVTGRKVRDVVIIHRLGRLEIGETSVLIVVAAAHRAAAFEACRWLIDTLKQTVPIWKKEYFEDGAIWAAGEPFPAEIPRPGGTNF